MRNEHSTRHPNTTAGLVDRSRGALGKQYLGQTAKPGAEEAQEVNVAELATGLATTLVELARRHRATMAESSDTPVETR